MTLCSGIHLCLPAIYYILPAYTNLDVLSWHLVLFEHCPRGRKSRQASWRSYCWRSSAGGHTTQGHTPEGRSAR